MSSLEIIRDATPATANSGLTCGKGQGKLFAEALHTFSARCIAIVSALLVSILTARALGPAGRGDYFLVVTFAALISQLSNFGLHSSNTYLVAKDRSAFGSLCANTIWISVFAGVLASLIGLGLIRGAHLAITKNEWALAFSIGLVPTNLFFVLGCSLLVGIGAIKKFNTIQVAAYGIVALFVAMAAGLQLGVRGFLAFTLLGWLVTSAILAKSLHIRGVDMRFDPGAFLKGWRYSAKAYTATLLGLLVLRSNIFLLKFLCGSREVGFYSIAAQMTDALGVLPVAVGTVLFPRLVTETGTAWEMTKRAALTVSGIMLVLCLAGFYLARPFVRLVYGAAFLPAVPAVQCMLPGALLLGVTCIISQFLSAQGFPRAQVLIWLASFALNLAISGVLISRASATGAAIGISATYCLTFLLLACLAFKIKRRASRAGYAFA